MGGRGQGLSQSQSTAWLRQTGPKGLRGPGTPGPRMGDHKASLGTRHTGSFPRLFGRFVLLSDGYHSTQTHCAEKGPVEIRLPVRGETREDGGSPCNVVPPWQSVRPLTPLFCGCFEGSGFLWHGRHWLKAKRTKATAAASGFLCTLVHWTGASAVATLNFNEGSL